MVQTQKKQQLTQAQQGIWLAEQLGQSGSAFNTAEFIHIKGNIDINMLQVAIAQMVREASGLHTVFIGEGNAMKQVLQEADEVEIELIDMSREENATSSALEWMEKDRKERLFSLSEGPLFKEALIQISETEVFWYQCIHHFVVDGYSYSLLAKRVADLYSSAVLYKEPLTKPFNPLSNWLEEDATYQDSEQMKQDQVFWQHELKEFEGAASTASRKPTYHSDFHRRSFSFVEPSEPPFFSAEERLLASVAIYMEHFSGKEEVVLGLPLMNRLGSAALKVPASTMNIVPLRLHVSSSLTVTNLLEVIRERVREVKKHGRYRQEWLRQEQGLSGSGERLYGPLVNVMPFDYQLLFGNARGIAQNLSTGPVEDISIQFYKREKGEGYRLVLDGNPDLYNEEELRRHGDCILRIFAQMNQKDAFVGQLALVDETEGHLLDQQVNQTAREVPNGFFVDAIEQHRTVLPDAPALICEGETLKYGALADAVNQMAHFLSVQGVGHRSIVGVSLPRSKEMVVTLLAVLKLGAVYLPLDPTFPLKRLTYMVDDAAPTCVVTKSDIKLPIFSAPLLFLDKADWQSYSTGPIQVKQAVKSDAAYVIYTSGSTGNPKGVIVSRGSLHQFLHAMQDEFQLTHSDVFLAVTTIAFDISALELYMPLIAGATLVVAGQGDIHNPDTLASLASTFGVTHMQATPALWQMLVSERTDAVEGRHVLVGGEALPTHLKNALLELGHSATNLYGPTETTIWSAVERLSKDKEPVLGSPIWNTQLYVLDKNLRQVNVGTTGELYIAGQGLARGYLGKPAQTASVFIANPYGAHGERMYKTGDLARWQPDGTLEFQGRADYQIKLRGFRIELGEIEEVLHSYPDVSRGVVVVAGEKGNERLVAYVQTDAEEVDLKQALLSFVSEKLPDYMMPSQFVFLETLPLTPNGKVDRKALPEPVLPQVVGRKVESPEEELLAELFAQVLGLASVNVEDGFFALGGHSLLAVQLTAQIKQAFQVDLNISDLFEHPTVEQMAAFIERAKSSSPIMKVKPRPEKVPLSLEQKRLWFLHQLDPDNPVYNIPFVVELEGEIDGKALSEALTDLVTWHEPLRTLFREESGIPYQAIGAADEYEITLEKRFVSKDRLDDEMKEAIQYRFQIDIEPAIHCRLLCLSEQKAVFVIVLHHIAADGWSLAALGRDLSKAYAMRAAGEKPAEELEPRFQYADYALWQQDWLRSGRLDEQLVFWTNELAGLPEQLAIPTDGERHPTVSVEAGFHRFAINHELLDALKQLAKKCDVSLYMVLQASLASFLMKLGAGTDIPIGTPIARRKDAQVENLIGLFINTIVLRTDVSKNPSFVDLVNRVKRSNLLAYKHQDAPFDQVVEHLSPVRVAGLNPLFQVMLVLQQTPGATVEIEGVHTETRIEPVGAAKFDLTFELEEKNGEMAALVEYRTDLFDAPRIEEMATQWLRVLTQVVAAPHQPIGALNLRSNFEIQAPLFEQVSEEHHLVRTFEQNVKASPDHIAVTYKNLSLSYEQLDQRANQLAHELMRLGAAKGTFVAIALPRSLDIAVALLAVLKTGAAYVPIDPTSPKERFAYIAADARPVCMITVLELEKTMMSGDCPVLALDDELTRERRSCYPLSSPVLVRTRKATDPAYMIYTSGSTGNPKGVIVPDSNVLRLFEQTNEWYCFSSEDVWSMFHSYAFDFAVWEFWGALLYGGKVVLVPQEETRSPEMFLERLIAEKVTVLNQTPSAFYAFAKTCVANQAMAQQLALKTIIFGGEALDFSKLDSWYNLGHKAQLVNMYGITETTVHVTYAAIEQNARGKSHIGKPIPDLGVYVLDEWLQPVPDGVIGEMFVSGRGVAIGYAGMPALTAERFIADPFGAPGSRMYRTGDLAIKQGDGTLMYMGRRDKQVKVRGHRIELGEIDAALLKTVGVLQVATVLRETVGGENQLISYLVTNEEDMKEVGEMRRQLANHLPEYMIPASLEVLDELPLTTNGKLDEKALPDPDFQHAIGEMAPRTPQEEVLCTLFAETLSVKQVGIDGHFFDLGGHSLLAVQLLSKINEWFGTSLSMAALFEDPTVAGLSVRLETGETKSALDVLLPLRSSGKKPPLFCIHPAGGLSWCYAGLMAQIDKDIPIYGIQARGIGTEDAMPRSIREMASDYVNQIKQVQGQGPYRLLGWSLGGNVIQEMAAILEEAGESVTHLFIMDAYPREFLPNHGQPTKEESLLGLLALAGFEPEHYEDVEELTMDEVIRILSQDGSALSSLDEGTIDRMRKSYVNSVQCLREHDPTVYHGNAVFFRSMLLPDWMPTIAPEVWQAYIKSGVDVYDLACRHKDMCQPEPLRQIARVVSTKLSEEE